MRCSLEGRAEVGRKGRGVNTYAAGRGKARKGRSRVFINNDGDGGEYYRLI